MEMNDYNKLMTVLIKAFGKDTKPKIRTIREKFHITILIDNPELAQTKRSEVLQELPERITDQIVLTVG